MPAAAAVAPVAPVPIPLSPWADARFQVPVALIGATLLATATFVALHFALRGGDDRKPPQRDSRGWKFPQLGYVLCPQGEGLRPTEKPVERGSIVILVLGSPAGQSVEPVWAKVAEVDPRDANRIAVVLVGQASETGQVPLQTDRHGFRLSQKLWVTSDCVWDVLQFLDDPHGRLLCGAELVNFDGSDSDTSPDGYRPVAPPFPIESAVGRLVELMLVSRAAMGTAWQVPVTARVAAVSPAKHIGTVKVTAVGRDEAADDPLRGHHVRAGTTFDITWDCVLQYL